MNVARGTRDTSNLWAKLWKLEIHDMLKMFLWRLMAGVLPTREILAERIGIRDRSCVICGEEIETSFHLFKDCQGIRVLAFASKWGCLLENWAAANVGEII